MQVIQVEASLKEKSQISLTEISALTSVSRALPICVMHSEIDLKSYKIQTYKKLLEEKYDRRVKTAKQQLSLFQKTVLENLFF